METVAIARACFHEPTAFENFPLIAVCSGADSLLGVQPINAGPAHRESADRQTDQRDASKPSSRIRP
jgi:hypothetical protein